LSRSNGLKSDSSTDPATSDSSARTFPGRFGGVLVVLISLTLYRWYSVSFRAPLPVDRIHVATGRTDESSCINCHKQAEQFHATGHANTLVRSQSPDSLTLLAGLGQCESARNEGTILETQSVVPLARNVSSDAPSQVSLDWCFGSGRHARTWVTTLMDSQGATDLLEFRWTWYHEINGFDVTPGQPEEHFATHLGPFGVLYDHPKARRCFACHSSYLPVDDGRLRLEDIEMGVNCQRCHGPRAEHVASEGAVHDDFWQTASPLEAVNRCAQCHRRPEEVDADELRADDPDLARFQPVGLIRSKCFTVSQKMTCTTCHDPHRPLEAQDSLGDWQCLQCHDPAESSDTLCKAGEPANCLQCHMPKVHSTDPLRFTDHWIRVR
jgi:hypothetical protein